MPPALRSAAILIVFLAAVPAVAGSAESVVRRYLTLAYDGRLDALPKTPAARTERFERQVRNILRVRCIDVQAMQLSPAGESTVHADVLIEKRERQGDWTAVDFVPLRFELVRDGDGWLVAEVANRDEDFAVQLLKASAEERERLLREQPERIGKGLARALYARVMVHLNHAAWKEAIDANALTMRIALDAADRGGQALSLGAGTFMTDPKDTDGPDRLSAEAVAIAESLGDPDILARAWYDRGRSTRGARLEPARRNELLTRYRTARKLAERAEDPIILVRILYSLANTTVHGEADYLSARRYLDEALPIARESGDEFGEVGLEMVLSTIYLDQGDWDRGLFHHGRATELAEKSGALAYPSLLMRSGCLLVDQEKDAEARATLERGVTWDEAGRMTPFRSMPGSSFASALRCLAVLEARSGNFAEAECLHQEAAPHHGGSPNAFLYELAPHFSKRGNVTGALALSLASLAEVGLYPNQRAAALLAAGHAYRRLGLVQNGLQAALEAIEIREGIDSRIAGDERQRMFASTATSAAYHLAAELSLEGDDPVAALAFLERGRARVLTDLLTNGRPGMQAEADSDARQQEAALDREVTRVSTALEGARTAGNPKRVDELEGELSRARAIRATFLDGMRARSERWDATRRRTDPEALGDLGARLPPRTLAVEYFISESELHTFVARPGGVVVRSRQVGREKLHDQVKAFLRMATGGDLRVESAARALYALLIEPIEKDIAGADALLIVPDGPLWRVPFAALVDGRGKFLVESRAVVYAPSITAYASITNLRRQRELRQVALFAVGNPAKDAAASKAAASFYRDVTLGPLPDAEREVDAVRALYDSASAVVLKRNQATEARTKEELPGATIAHFATHAILDDANPMYSRLMLARDGRSSDDGWLESWEVARLTLDADLVVLSACDTARGRVGGGEGVVGLTWSFFLAGAASTVATQWKVDSATTAELMIAFHQALQADAVQPALHKAQSLREAQLRLLRNPRTRHPFHWAAFVLLGDPAR